jgi:hypothetical protein
VDAELDLSGASSGRMELEMHGIYFALGFKI